MDNVTFRRRNKLKKRFVITDKVLLYGYPGLSDGAKLTYLVLDGFDWEDEDGVRKGFAFPSKAHLAEIRGVDERTVQRHIQELEAAGLVTREGRAGQTNIYWIEDASEEEARRCKEKLKGGDKNASPGVTEMSPVIIRTEERLNDVNEGNATFPSKTWEAPSEAEQGYLVHEMLSVLRDAESEGYYRRLAATVPKDIIFEALSLVKRAVHEGKIRKSRGALFVAIVKRACADRGVMVGESPVGVR
jgi:DNA-binding transcriptional regulator YhcF (GntR family)